MTKEEQQITDIVNRETKAWSTQDTGLLISIFHPDMVWPWPRTYDSHDPEDWIFVLGKYNEERWCKNWQDLFDNNILIHNNRKIIKIVISDEKDAGFAVVDIDTLWKNNKTGKEDNWKGRVCKVYGKIGNEWKMTMHTGVLNY